MLWTGGYTEAIDRRPAPTYGGKSFRTPNLFVPQSQQRGRARAAPPAWACRSCAMDKWVTMAHDGFTACPGVCPPPQRSLCVTPNRAFYCSLSARPFSLKAPVPPPPHPRLVQHAPSTLVLLCVTPRPFISFVFLPQSPSEATSLEPLGGDGEKCPGWRESPGTPPSVPSLLPLSLFADEHDEVQPLRDLGPQQKLNTNTGTATKKASNKLIVTETFLLFEPWLLPPPEGRYPYLLNEEGVLTEVG